MLGTIQSHAHLSFIQRRSHAETTTLPRPYQLSLVNHTFPGLLEAMAEGTEHQEEAKQPEEDTPLSQSTLVDQLFSKLQAKGYKPPTSGKQFPSDPAGDGPDSVTVDADEPA